MGVDSGYAKWDTDHARAVLDRVFGPEAQFVIRAVVEETAEQAVRNTLTTLGFDTRNPVEVQRDVATMREVRTMMANPEWQADQMHLRQWRTAMEDVKSKGIIAALGLAALGVLAAMVFAVKWKLG